MSTFMFDRLDALLKSNGMTRKALCQLSGHADNYIRMFEKRGKEPPRDFVLLCAQQLGTTSAYLYGETDSPEKEKRICRYCVRPRQKGRRGGEYNPADLIAIIRDIRQRGGQLKDIVILVRGGKEGALVADFLMEYNKTADRPIGFISMIRCTSWSSPYIQFIIRHC